MENTANETWIKTLVDELVAAKNENCDKSVDSSQLDTLVDIILNSSRLDYDGKGLRIDSESVIFGYLRAIYPNTYNERIRILKAEREAENRQYAELAEQTTKEAKNKKEAQ